METEFPETLQIYLNEALLDWEMGVFMITPEQETALTELIKIQMKNEIMYNMVEDEESLQKATGEFFEKVYATVRFPDHWDYMHGSMFLDRYITKREEEIRKAQT